MSILKLNWIKYFHNTQISPEVMQKTFNFISELSPGIAVSIEDISINTSSSTDVAIMIIKSLVNLDLLTLSLKCPVCKEKITLVDELIISCAYCDTEINMFTLPMAIVNLEASLTYLLKNKIDDNSYETNAEILSRLSRENGILYYLITDIVDSQTQQKVEPNKYLIILDNLWEDLWPRVFHVVKKASLPLLARGDAVSWIFASMEDLLSTIEEIYLYLYTNPITKLSIYGSKLSIPNHIKAPFMRSLDKKWDLNTPSVTDLYRKTNFKPGIWEETDNYIIKYCLFDELAKEQINTDEFSFIKNSILIDYSVPSKHNNSYKGKCLAGYCNAEVINTRKEPPHA
jgi:hypothetical protein